MSPQLPACSYTGHQKLEVETYIHSKILSKTVSLSEKSLAEDATSISAPAGSLLAYRREKMENTSVDTQCSLIVNNWGFLISEY